MRYGFGILSMLILVVGSSSCLKKKIDSGADSNLASITVGKVDQKVIAYDSVTATVSANGKSADYSSSAQLAAAKFKAGDAIKIQLRLLSAGKIVAQTIVGNGKCDQVSLTLVAGKNPVKVPLCSSSNPSADPIVVDPSTADSNADVEAQPCIADKGDCKDGGVVATPTDTGGGSSTSTTSVPGKCKKEDALFKTNGGGCQLQENGLVYSALSNFNGVKKELTLANADAYCSNLVEGGQNDWRLPSEAELFYLKGVSITKYFQFADSGIVGITFWTTTTTTMKEDSYNFKKGTILRVVDILIWGENMSRDENSIVNGQNGAHSVLCVRN